MEEALLAEDHPTEILKMPHADERDMQICSVRRVENDIQPIAVLPEIKGGYGTVRFAMVKGLFSALKYPNEDFYRDTESVLRREAVIGMHIAHPNIVDTHGLMEDNRKKLCLWMEGIPGFNLHEAVKRNPVMSLALRVRALAGACTGLDFMHENGWVHRDVKPTNIMCADGGKVIDLGCAHPIGHQDENFISGTPHFMSPEQAAGACADPSTDAYAVGVTLYFLLTGRFPYETDDRMHALYLVQKGEYEPIRAITVMAPEALVQISENAMKRTPSERPPCGFMAERLKEIAKQFEKIEEKEAEKSKEESLIERIRNRW